MNILFAIATGMLFAMGVFQLLRRDLVKSAMGFYILFTAVNLFFLAVGAFDPRTPAYIDPATNTIAGGESPGDPLVQALILTAIVISFASYALFLALVNISSRRYQTIDSDEVKQLVR